ncbi:MAG: HD domain-containing protein [Clostridia bacterium]|nr:HD domain-containing protein [Clostridia bacterium]
MIRLEKLQRKVLEIVEAESKITDKTREVGLHGEIIHSIGCCRLAQIAALKRNLDMEISGIIGLLHDYGRITTGSKQDHALKAKAPLELLLKDTSLFTEKEITTIITAVANHSSKNIKQGPYDELIKDVDILENYLSGKIREDKVYMERLALILKELGIEKKEF